MCANVRENYLGPFPVHFPHGLVLHVDLIPFESSQSDSQNVVPFRSPRSMKWEIWKLFFWASTMSLSWQPCVNFTAILPQYRQELVGHLRMLTCDVANDFWWLSQEPYTVFNWRASIFCALLGSRRKMSFLLTKWAWVCDFMLTDQWL